MEIPMRREWRVGDVRRKLKVSLKLSLKWYFIFNRFMNRTTKLKNCCLLLYKINFHFPITGKSKSVLFTMKYLHTILQVLAKTQAIGIISWYYEIYYSVFFYFQVDMIHSYYFPKFLYRVFLKHLYCL